MATKKKAVKKTSSSKSKSAKKSASSNGKPSQAPTKASSRPVKKKKPAQPSELPYPIVNVLPYFDKRYNPKALGSLTADKAKEFLAWREESENLKFTGSVHFRDRNGKRVRCNNNLNNRPFYPRLAEDYMLEILRGKWKLNGETCIVDKTAMVQDSQHRMVGLVWAVQEWLKNPAKWQKYWDTEPVIDTIIVVGIDGDDETVNTLNTGKRRTLADAIYRSEYFRDMPMARRRRAAKIAEWSIRLIWYRTGQVALSAAPRMPHSEAVDFIDRHPKVLKAVRHIQDLDGKTSAITGYIPPGYAAGLLYLMGCSNSDRETYERRQSEEGIDFDCWQDALDYWKLISTKAKDLEPLLDCLLDIPEDAGGGYARAWRCGLAIKAWNLYIKSEDVVKSKIKLRSGRDRNEHLKIQEHPICGGIDTGGDTTLTQEPEDDQEEDE